MRVKKWTVLASGEKRPTNQEEILKILLKNRGLNTKKAVEEFLNPPSPYTLTASRLGIDSREVAKAVKRLKKAIKNGEKIIVYGDYDTDGVCATAIIWETLHQLGAQVMPFIPTRGEGYGLKAERIGQFKKEGVSLIITVDHGIIAYDQLEQAKKIGLEVIVTDHHLPGKKKLKAYALIHTIKLSGAGVAWFLCCQLDKPGLELVTIGTVADIMPLLDVNRAIVKYGLQELRETKIPGLLALFEIAGLPKEKIGMYEIGFIIAPRLNAAGRMEDPMDALRLLCTKKWEKTKELADSLNQHNRQRQLLMEEMTLHARALWLSQDGKGKLIFVSHESYEEGIVGLVAGKLMEEFYRPAIVVARGETHSRASARSINGFNIVEAIRACGDLLGSHGGHAMAAGFTVETTRLEELKLRLLQLAEKQIDEEKLNPILKIDSELDCSSLTFDLWEKLLCFAPFGFGNPEPVFLTRNLEVVDAHSVGASSQHLKLRITCPVPASSVGGSRVTFDAIGFSLGSKFSSLSPEKRIDLVYNLVVDEWNGKKRLQLKIKDLRLNDGN